MRVAVLGATGATGALVVQELRRRDVEVVALTRNPAAAPAAEGVRWIAGDVRDDSALSRLVEGADAVVSALGPRKRDGTLHRDVAPRLVDAMQSAGVRRFVGISGAGISVPGDRKSLRDRAISGLMQRVGGDLVRDKALEYEAWSTSGLDWTLARAPRLVDGDATGAVDSSASRSPRRTKISRADLAAFVVDLALTPRYVGEAPLVAAG